MHSTNLDKIFKLQKRMHDTNDCQCWIKRPYKDLIF